MLHLASDLFKYKLLAPDGEIGHIQDIYFDDDKWGIRYIVVNTHQWRQGPEVLISPPSIETLLTSERLLKVNLTREQIRNCPTPDEHEPLSRHFERKYHQYFGWPVYWAYPGIWPGYMTTDVAGLRPHPPAGGPLPETPTSYDLNMDEPDDETIHLRAMSEVKGYAIHSSDQERFGEVQDFVVDDQQWALRYVVVDTVKWWPSRHVLLSPVWIRDIDWSASELEVGLEKEKIKSAPAFKRDNLNRDYEDQLFEHYEQPKYWEEGEISGLATPGARGSYPPQPDERLY